MFRMSDFQRENMDYTIAHKQIIATPDYADYVLATYNVRNRNLDDLTIERYIEQIKREAFYFTHQGIARDRNGYLMDGQHRLTAIKRSGKSLPMFEFTYSIDQIQENGDLHPVMMVFDKGRARSVAQNLKLNGMANAQLITAICNAIRGFLFGNAKARSDEFMVNAIYSVYIDGIDAIVSAGWGQRDRHAIMMASLVLMHSAAPDKAAQLARAIASMEGLKVNTPEMAINTFFRGPLRVMTGHSQRIEAMERIINGCVKYLDGEPLKALCSSQSSLKLMRDVNAKQKAIIEASQQLLA